MQATATLPHTAEDKGAVGDFPRPQAGCHNGLRSDVRGCCGGHSASVELQSDVQQDSQHTRSAHQSWLQGSRQSCHRRVSNAQSRTPITVLWKMLRQQGRDSTETPHVPGGRDQGWQGRGMLVLALPVTPCVQGVH